MIKKFNVINGEDGKRYLNTYNKHLAFGLAFALHHFLVFDTDKGKLYSFECDDKTLKDAYALVKMRSENNKDYYDKM